MIVKDEEGVLGGSISSAKQLLGVRDIVVVDTGSKDRTREIAEEEGARVFEFEWIKDFSAARNFAASKTENDWIIWLDADLTVTEADMGAVGRLIDDISCIGVVTWFELADNSAHNNSQMYNRLGHSFEGIIHEGLSAIKGIQSRWVPIPIVMEHSGYLPDAQHSQGRFERNASLLEMALREKPDDPYYLFQMGKCYNIHTDNKAKACEYFEKALAQSPDIHLEYVYVAVETYGYALLNTGRYEDALQLLYKYYPHYKKNPNFRFLAAHIYQNNGMFIEAVEQYESCLGANVMPDPRGITSYLSYYNIGVVLECVNMIEDAVGMYEQCGDYGPAKARLRELKGCL